MKKIIPFIAIVTLFANCNSSKSLHGTGTYTIKSRTGKITEFKEVRGRYILDSDTLKVNDKVVINVIKSANKKP